MPSAIALRPLQLELVCCKRYLRLPKVPRKTTTTSIHFSSHTYLTALPWEDKLDTTTPTNAVPLDPAGRNPVCDETKKMADPVHTTTREKTDKMAMARTPRLVCALDESGRVICRYGQEKGKGEVGIHLSISQPDTAPHTVRSWS